MSVGKANARSELRGRAGQAWQVEVGFHRGVQRSSGFRCFSAELASKWRHGCAQDARSE